MLLFVGCESRWVTSPVELLETEREWGMWCFSFLKSETHSGMLGSCHFQNLIVNLGWSLSRAERVKVVKTPYHFWISFWKFEFILLKWGYQGLMLSFCTQHKCTKMSFTNQKQGPRQDRDKLVLRARPTEKSDFKICIDMDIFSSAFIIHKCLFAVSVCLF